MPACIAARLIRLNYDLYVKASEYRACFAADSVRVSSGTARSVAEIGIEKVDQVERDVGLLGDVGVDGGAVLDTALSHFRE